MRCKLVLIILLTALMAALVLLQVPGVNGPWYWTWPYRVGEHRLPAWPLYASMLLAAVPFALAQSAYARGRVKLAVMLLAVTTLSLELTALAHLPPTGLRRVTAIVQSAVNTSYYTDAYILDEQENIATWEFLYQYPDLVPLLHLHAKYKPPGLVLYYLVWVKIFGKGAVAATVGWTGVALLAALAPVACFRMLRFFGRDEQAAFCGSSFLAMCPSLLLFLPQFDQVYPAIACVILLLWGMAARDERWLAALGCGAVLALGLFMSYIFLVLGCFVVMYWLLLAADRGSDVFWRAAMMGMLALAAVAALYGLLFTLTGFNPIATFHSISRTQAQDLLPLARPFPQHILFDLLDFALGSAWISFLLVLFFLVGAGGSIFDRSPRNRLVLLALVQIATVAAAALLPGETARLWLLLYPLLMAPIGFELASWPAKSRMIVYGCLWLLLVVICQNMTLIYMGPELDGPRW